MSNQYSNVFPGSGHQGNFPNQMMASQMRNQMGGTMKSMSGMGNMGMQPQLAMMNQFNPNMPPANPMMMQSPSQQSPQAMPSPGMTAHGAPNSMQSPSSSHASPSSVFSQSHSQHTPPHMMQSQGGSGNHTPVHASMSMPSPQHHQIQMQHHQLHPQQIMQQQSIGGAGNMMINMGPNPNQGPSNQSPAQMMAQQQQQQQQQMPTQQQQMMANPMISPMAQQIQNQPNQPQQTLPQIMPSPQSQQQPSTPQQQQQTNQSVPQVQNQIQQQQQQQQQQSQPQQQPNQSIPQTQGQVHPQHQQQPPMQQKEFNIVSLCRYGQETVQDILSRFQEVFGALKSVQPPNTNLQASTATATTEKKVTEQFRTIRLLFKRLRLLFEKCNDSCQLGMEYTNIENLIQLVDDINVKPEPAQSEEYKKHLQENRELTEAITLKNKQLREIIDRIRIIIWEINTMLSMRRS